MKIELWGDRAHTQTVSFPGSIAELGIALGDVEFFGEYRVTCTIQRNYEIARVSCSVTAPAKMICSRCLAEYPQELSGEFEFVARHLKLGEEAPVDEALGDIDGDTGDMVFVPYGEIAVDISQYVLDALVLSIPVKPLCSEDCKGLCPECAREAAVFNQRTCERNRCDRMVLEEPDMGRSTSLCSGRAENVCGWQ